MECKK